MYIMHKTYESFRVCLERIIRERDITAAELSRILGHKSKTTLSRVFSGTAGMDSIRKVYREVSESSALSLTEEEKAALALAVHTDEVGEGVLRARDQIRELLQPTRQPVPEIVMQSETGAFPLCNLTGLLRQSDSAEVLILNCSSRALARELAVLLGSAAMDKLTVRHFMAVNSDPARTASMIVTLTGLFGFPNYTCFSVRGGSDPTGPLAFIGMNCIACRVVSDGAVREYQMMFPDEYSGVIHESAGIFAYWERYLALLDISPRPIKTTYPPVFSPGDYLTFTDTYRRLEENRNVYMFKPDVCLNQIETEILKNACLDGARQAGLDTPDFTRTIERLAEIQQMRYRNTFTQHKVTHVVFSETAIRKFAETGCTSDHFFLMRPYTKAERARILENLAHQTRTNPYFNAYLLRDDRGFTGMEATCYEGEGVQFIPADTDYNLATGHTEAIIVDEEFCGIFLHFFREDLLKHHVTTTAAAAKLFGELAEELMR